MQIFLNSYEISLKDPIPQDLLESRFSYDDYEDFYYTQSCKVVVDESGYVESIVMFAPGSRIDNIESGFEYPEDYEQIMAEIESLGYILTVYEDAEGYMADICIDKDYLTVQVGSDTISLRADRESSNTAIGQGEDISDTVTVWKKGDTFQKIFIAQSDGYKIIASGKFELLEVLVGEINYLNDMMNSQFFVEVTDAYIAYQFDQLILYFSVIPVNEELAFVQSVAFYRQF